MIKSFISSRNFKKGQSFFSHKDYKNAVEYFRKAAEDGHADAQFNLGILYGKGLGVDKNKEDALRWLGKAAGQGHAGAKTELGLVQKGNQVAISGSSDNLDLLRQIIETSHERPKIMSKFLSLQMGIPQEQEEPVLVRKEAEEGDLDMQRSLARNYHYGDYLPQNYREALKWYTKLATQEDGSAQTIVGEFFFMGYDVERNLVEAEKWWRKAVKNGDEKAQLYLKILSGQETRWEKPEKDESFDKLKILYRELGGDRIGTLAWYREQAEKGIADYQYKLGAMYDEGTYISEDSKEAVKWYRKAAEQGHEVAQNNLGHAYVHGEGVEQDYGEAVKWFRKAADQGDSNAQFNLGMRYRDGQGVEKNLTEAFKWIKKAVDQGNEFQMAQSIIGQAYLFGEGTAQNFTEAARWLTRATEKNDLDAHIYLGWCYVSGNGVTKNIESAEKLFKGAAEQGHTESVKLINFSKNMNIPFENMHINIIRTHHDKPATLDEIMYYGPGTPESSKVQLIDSSVESPLEKLYKIGNKYIEGDGIEKNQSEGAKLIKEAAEKGYAPAQSLYSYLLEEGIGVPKDSIEALKWIKKAAEQGDPDSQFQLGYQYEHAEGLPQDDVEAVRWYKKSAYQGYGEGQLHYGLMLYYGCGVPEKKEEDGLMWIRRAAEQGHEYAEKVLEDLSNTQETALDEPFEELYKDGLKEKNAGNFDKAIVIWKKILEKDFRHLNAINAIACAYAESGKLDMAKKYIDTAMKVGGDQADFVRINLAGILYDSGKFDEAEEILNAIECKDGRMLDNLTRVLVAQGKSERALGLIEEFLAKEGASTIPDTNEDRSFQEIFTRGVDCILECKSAEAIHFLETYAHILSPEPLSSVYFNAGIHFLQEENDGVRALRCLSEAVRNKPDDSEMKEALSDAALKVIADFGGQGKISETEKASLATAYETAGNRQKALEIKKQMASVEIGEEKKPSLRLVTTEMKPFQNISTEDKVIERKSYGSENLQSFWNEIALKVGHRTGLNLITSIENSKAITQILFRPGIVKGVFFVFSLRANDWVVRIDIDFGAGKDQANREFFDKLEREASAIENVFGERLTWEKGKGRSCKIICPSGIGGYKNLERLISVEDTMVDIMARLERAVGPVIEKLGSA